MQICICKRVFYQKYSLVLNVLHKNINFRIVIMFATVCESICEFDTEV